jgi:hypothetical protein
MKRIRADREEAQSGRIAGRLRTIGFVLAVMFEPSFLTAELAERLMIVRFQVVANVLPG